ncbi:terminase large subunit domain-containing protein [Sphingomonas sp.]|jgi:phage terminase large subunit-like protein|uniref:terminase large subunit domain-containing protein n=1 Tax=Sphingomonas sp. TaxID=28214 RepID=UPI002E3426E4|nr:terminase family protein [Sphingomonas sp.]HEX4694891.1 terminase family protein [Sphingomonas sp.]
MTPADGELLRRVMALPERERRMFFKLAPEAELTTWGRDWRGWAHPGQREPDGDWRTWVMMAGRGFGKTLAGAQWVHHVARTHGAVAIAIVAATVEEARRVMVEGRSGILSVPCHPVEAPRFDASLRRIVFPGGAEATLFSGANPESLRGPEHHFAWCDELAKWRHPEETWDMLQLGLRGGGLAGASRPRALVTTTPRAGVDALKAILGDVDTVVTGGESWRNPHVPDAYLAAIVRSYGGTRRGREEIDGELVEDIEGTLWPAALIEASRGAAPAPDALVRVVIGVDPPASAAGTCGIVACGLDVCGVGHVLADHSASGLSPEGWARRVAIAAETHDADRVVVETNQGGAMVGAVLRGVGLTLPVTNVTATRGKAARAEPVAGLFEAGRTRLAGRFPALEAELAGLVPGRGYAVPGRSPDRADAMVWALWALLIAGRAPSIRLA